MKYYISSPPMNPISRILAAAGALLVLVGAFFFGLVVLGVLLAVFVLFASAFWVRNWWSGRGPADASVTRTRPPAGEDVIEAEYTVISKRRD